MRNAFIAAVCAVLAMFIAPIAHAQGGASQPLVVFANGLGEGWNDYGSWADRRFDVPMDGDQTVIGVTFKPWSTLKLGHDAVDVSGYKTLTVLANGGQQGRQNIRVQLCEGADPDKEKFVMLPNLKKNQWQRFDIPLEEFKLNGSSVTCVWFTNQSEHAYKEMFLNFVILQ